MTLPIGAKTELNLRNAHLSYAMTWYGIALALVGVYGAFHYQAGRLRFCGKAKGKAMHYYSTRGQDGPLGYEDALLSGLARDGGLYLPETWPKFSHEDIAAMQGLSYAELAGRIMAPFCVGELKKRN